MGVLSATEPESLIDAIIHEDQQSLTRIPGIGKKTAERMVVELRDTMKKKVDAGVFRQTVGEKKNGNASANVQSVGSRNPRDADLIRDAQAALMTLGYREHEVYSLLKKTLEESEPRLQRAEDLIKSALRHLA